MSLSCPATHQATASASGADVTSGCPAAAAGVPRWFTDMLPLLLHLLLL
jgi:hypothetical protein